MRIEISGEQPELKETTTRDGGLIKTETYYQFVEFFYDYVLKRLENYVVNVIRWGDERVNKETGESNAELWAKDVKVEILELITGFINSKDIIDIQYNKDFLEIKDSYLEYENLVILGNLPYNISSQILTKLIKFYIIFYIFFTISIEKMT